MTKPTRSGPPVLDTVVHGGDESIIQSTRLGQQVLDQLQAMQRDCMQNGMTRGLDGRRLDGATPISFPSLDAVQADGSAGEDETRDVDESIARAHAHAHAHVHARRIDALIDHHLGALKRDLLGLLSPS